MHVLIDGYGYGMLWIFLVFLCILPVKLFIKGSLRNWNHWKRACFCLPRLLLGACWEATGDCRCSAYEWGGHAWCHLWRTCWMSGVIFSFCFPIFPWMRFQWEKFHNNLSIGFMTWMCHFVDASWVSGTWSAGHGEWWFHVRSFERHVFVGFIDGHVVL